MSFIKIGTLSRTATTLLSISSIVLALPIPRIKYSLPESIYEPPEEFSFDSSAAFSTSFNVILYEASFSGETKIWYCFTAPPIGITCDTPFIERSRLLISKSANVLKSISVRFCGLLFSSILRLMSIISPIIEEIGARTGLSTPFGRLAAAI